MKEILEKIEEKLRICGDIILNADRSLAIIDEKSGHANLVTTYDKMVQEKLMTFLSEILPEAKFVGEEGDEEKSDVSEGYVFIVDPIDGTTNFVKDYHMSCISVGLLKDGEPYIGAVFNPYLNEMFTAIRGEGAFLNGNLIHVSEQPLSNGVVLFGSAPYYEELHQKSFDTAFYYFKKAMDIRRSGSAALDLCHVACGRAELFFELRVCPWDFAAGALIVTEAGGKVSTFEGTPLIYDGKCSILATNAVVSKEL